MIFRFGTTSFPASIKYIGLMACEYQTYPVLEPAKAFMLVYKSTDDKPNGDMMIS